LLWKLALHRLVRENMLPLILKRSLKFDQNQIFGQSNRLRVLTVLDNVKERHIYLPKIEILFKNRNICQKYKFSSKIEIFVKNINFLQKYKFCSKVEILINPIY